MDWSGPVGAEMSWWGWGDPSRRQPLPEHAVEILRDRVGMATQLRPPVAIEDVDLRPSTLSPDARAALVAAVGDCNVCDDRRIRIQHAAGKGYLDLVRQRAGDAHQAPDAVVFPGSHAEVLAVLKLCVDLRVAVVPFGGGTSVVGGVSALRGGCLAVIALDLARLNALTEIDDESLTAVFGAGLRGPDAEAALNANGLTLGHFPQSYEYASIGGYVATRSAGQASTGYGRIDELVVGLKCATPVGDIDLAPMPASAAGPKLAELFIGSEGTLGVITQAALRVHRLPEVKRYEGWFFRSFAEGAQALRMVEQSGASPDVARLSDEEETQLSMALAGAGGAKGAVGRRYLGLRGYSGGCLAIFGWEGTRAEVSRRRSRTAALLSEAGGLAVGRSPGEHWAKGRFAGPYLRDDLLERGVMVETLETATQWSNVMDLHVAVAGALRSALTARGTPALVMCHISHLYPTGASLYFTFIARQEIGSEQEQWQAAKTTACDAIVANGGTITHHHAIGTDHMRWMPSEVGEIGLLALRAMKLALDPTEIMNPGKLLNEA